MVYTLNKTQQAHNQLLYLNLNTQIFFVSDVICYHHIIFIYIIINVMVNYLIYAEEDNGIFCSYKVVVTWNLCNKYYPDSLNQQNQKDCVDYLKYMMLYACVEYIMLFLILLFRLYSLSLIYCFM